MRKKSKTKPEKLKKSFSLKIMKAYLAFFIIGFCSTMSAVTYSQTASVTLRLSNAKVETLFSEIEKSSDYVILYKKGIVENKIVSVDTRNESVETVLNRVLPPLNLSYHINGKQIIIVENKTIPVVEEVEQDPTIVASGVITDSAGEPLPGVSVVEKGKPTNGIMTDVDGNFSFRVNPGATLEISYIGFEKQEVKAAANLKIIMVESEKMLEDVVVVGYGVQKKVNLTGSVVSVNAKDLQDRPATNLLASIQGVVPGVTIITRPGSTPTINFRGRGNLTTSSPLYVIDGAIADATFFGNLDPNSIESISFLKDAASSAIYGSRAAYGVVLVKTKGATPGEFKINYNGFVGLKKATYTPKVLSSEWYARLSNEGALNDNPNAKLPYSEEEIQMFRDGSNPDMYPNTNWYDLILDDEVFTTRHSVSFSGGDKVKFFGSLGYMNDEGFEPEANDTRYNMSTNISADLKKWLTFRTEIKYIQNKRKRTGAEGSTSYLRFMTTPSTYVARHSNGEYGTYAAGLPAAKVDMERNPLRMAEQGGWSRRTEQNTLINLALDVKPIKDLVVTGEMMYKIYDYKDKAYKASLPALKDFKTGAEVNGSNIAESKMTYDWRESTRLLYNGLANYSLNLNEVHSLQFLAGISYEHYRNETQKSSRKNFPTNTMTGMNGGSNAPGDMSAEGTLNENKMFSYFGRVNYIFDNRYLFEANLRADASSRFHKDHRWGYYPSFSAGWRLSEEEFMKDVTWLDNLKIRGSWGKLGNINNIGDYDYQDSYITGGNYNFEDGAVPGIIEAKPANPTLGWEKIRIAGVGLDIDLFNNKLNIVADYYDKETRGILLKYNVPYEAGIHEDYWPSQNLGKVRNRGIEISMSHNNRIGDFSYTIGGNISRNWNKVLDMGESGSLYSDPAFVNRVGYPVGSFYLYRTDGLLTQEDIDNGNYITDGLTPNAGDIKYVDVHKDGKLTGEDREVVNCDVPNLTYGINLNLAYKGWELDAVGSGVGGTSVYFTMEQSWAFADFASPREFHLKRWTKENPNPNAEYPRIYGRTSSHSTYNQKASDFWLFNANYFRLKSLSFGYSFPKTMIKSIGLDALKLYVSAENLFTLRGDKRMKDFDPESASGRSGNTRGTQTFLFGVNVSF